MRQDNKTPLWYWIVAGLALLWNLAGLAAFAMHMMMTPEMLAQMPEAERALYTQAPDWLNVAFGMAVAGGTLASVMLLLRNFFAVVLFSLSLIGVLAQSSYSFLMSNTFEVLGPKAMTMPVAIIVIAALLMWFSIAMKNQGRLK